MVSTLVGAVTAAAANYRPASRSCRIPAFVDPNHQHLATLLLVSTVAFENRNRELYQAAIKAIVYLMSEERWKRLEIDWRMRQAISIAKSDSTPDLFEKLNCVAQNIARVTVHSVKALPWEDVPDRKLIASAA